VIPAVVLDTNIVVAAGFNPRSRSARILELIRQGGLRLVWDQATFVETRKIVSKIPPLDWHSAADLFTPQAEFTGQTDPSAYALIPDPDDRKFAALAAAAGAVLISNDDHLLGVRQQLDVTVLTPAEFLAGLD
jgi:uncharacterized protein